MTRASITGVCGICLLLFGCGRGERDRENIETTEVRPIPVTETGCLTARGDQFVLTDLQPGDDGRATTETYQLIGRDEELRQHVGKQVRVSGEAEAPRVAQIQESTPPPAKPAPTGTGGGPDPKVSVQAETRVEVRKLTVSSVQPTGSPCSAETQDEAATTPPRQ